MHGNNCKSGCCGKSMDLMSLFRQADEENRTAILHLIEINDRARIIDLGCGDGEFTIRIKEKAMTGMIHGVESCKDNTIRAQINGIEVVNADLNQKLPIEDEEFDVVHANQVIEHLVETDLFVKEIYRILKPGGYAIISTPNLASFHNLISLVLGKQPFTAHVSNEVVLGNSFDPHKGTRHSKGFSHLRIFTCESLRDMFEYHGFDMKTLIGAGFYPFPHSISSFLTRLNKTHAAYITIKARKRSM
jgi:methionine biosynthesis protein MetW